MTDLPTERSVVITGAGSGIGFAIAEALSEQGWFVVAVEADAQRADRIADRLPGPSEVVVGNVTDAGVLESALERAVASAPLLGWVNNAAVCPRGARVHDTPLRQVREVWEVNVVATFRGTQLAVIEFLRTSAAGSIVQISSIHGSRSFLEHPEYDMSKAAVESLARNVAVAYGPACIRANSIAPGAIETNMYANGIQAAQDSPAVRSTPLGRVGRPEEIATLAAFLLSDASSYVTGQTIGADGGWSAALTSRSPK